VISDLPVLQVPDAGSKISTDPSVIVPFHPPATRTFPEGSNVAVWACRAVIIAPTVVQIGSTKEGPRASV
jgi:hypothetical protein